MASATDVIANLKETGEPESMSNESARTNVSETFTEAKTFAEVSDYFQRTGFSGTAGVYSPSGSYERGFGIEQGAPIKASDLVLIGSVTKQFTAAATLRLLDLGKLQLSDAVSRYVAGVPNGITIHHLLVHTSGLAEMTERPEFSKLKRTRFSKLDPLVNMIVNLPPAFSVGAKWDYSNSNYVLLARIIEVVSGESWQNFLDRELFKRAGLKQTSFHVDRNTVIRGHTMALDRALVPISDLAYYERGWAHGSGGLESTAADLARWNEALYGGKVLSAHALKLMTTAHVVAEPGMSYGYGIMISKDEVTKETIYYHPGGIPGYISMNMYFPARRMSAIALANYEGFDESAQLAKAFAAIASGRRAKLPELNAPSESVFNSVE